MFARIDSNVDWYLADHQGSITDMTDSSGTLQNHIEYDGYGNIISETNSSFGDRYKYTSREWDAEIELQYNRARFYDPSIGRWISEDPIGFSAGDTNLQRYVNNAPTLGADPSGLFRIPFPIDELLPLYQFWQDIQAAKGYEAHTTRTVLKNTILQEMARLNWPSAGGFRHEAIQTISVGAQTRIKDASRP